jgi:hypothetical protein
MREYNVSPKNRASAFGEDRPPRFSAGRFGYYNDGETEALREMLELKSLQSGSAQPRLCVQQICQH